MARPDHSDLPGPLEHPAVWTADEMAARPEWSHRLTSDEQAELLAAAERALMILTAGSRGGGGPTGDTRPGTGPSRPSGLTHLEPADLPLPLLSGRLGTIRDQLEQGAGVVRLHGFPLGGQPEDRVRSMFWALAVHLGTPVSQSAAGERLFSVRDAGFASHDPRSRGPNTRRRLSFHTDRADVVGFLCVQQAASGGENQVASSMAVYNALRRRRPDLLGLLLQPFPYRRHTIDPANPSGSCRQPVFSFQAGHFACCFLRVLIDRAHADPDLPDLTPGQIEALDAVEEIAAQEGMHLAFRQEPGDLLFINNWTVLHRRTAFEDHPEPGRRRHILRVWLSMPDSRPLDPIFAGNWGETAAGAVRGGIRAATPGGERGGAAGGG